MIVTRNITNRYYIYIYYCSWIEIWFTSELFKKRLFIYETQWRFQNDDYFFYIRNFQRPRETLVKYLVKRNQFLILPLNSPAEFFLTISSALDVLRCSIFKFGMLKFCPCMLSELYRCLKGLCLSGLCIDIVSNFNLFLWFLKTIITVIRQIFIS